MEDLCKLTGARTCIYTTYECERLSHLSEEIKRAMTYLDQIQLKEAELRIYTCRLVSKIENLQTELENWHNAVGNDKKDMQRFVTNVTSSCEIILLELQELELPPVKPRFCDLSDAGPCVGVSNLQVKFSDAEICRIFSSDYRIRLYRSRGNSGKGEAERTNSAIGDAIVDGATIEWETFKQFEGMSQREIEMLTVKDLRKLKRKGCRRMIGLYLEN